VRRTGPLRGGDAETAGQVSGGSRESWDVAHPWDAVLPTTALLLAGGTRRFNVSVKNAMKPEIAATTFIT
jgi:hypothetical protein